MNPTGVFDLPENQILKAMTEEWNVGVAKSSGDHRKTKCTRCEGPIDTADYHFGCQKCIQLTSSTCVCMKCYDSNGICRVHKVELVKRTIKAWGALPRWQNYVDPGVEKGDDQLIQALKGNDLAKIDQFAGYQPLHVAAHLNLEAGAKLLIRHGASLEAKDQLNMTPLLVAIESGNIGIFKLLLESSVSITSASGNHATTAPHSAAANGRYDLISFILSQEVPVDLLSGRETALQIATLQGSMKCVKMLLAAGADPNANTGLYGAPLVSAARRKDNGKKLAEILLKHGANVEIKGGYQDGNNDEKDLTPLSTAVRLDHRDTLELLLQYGASIDAQDSGGLTCLMRASALGRVEILKVLLGRSADTEIQTSRVGITALLVAAMYGKEEVIDMLLESGASGIPPPSLGGKWKKLKKMSMFNELPAEKRALILKKLRAAKKKSKSAGK